MGVAMVDSFSEWRYGSLAVFVSSEIRNSKILFGLLKGRREIVVLEVGGEKAVFLREELLDFVDGKIFVAESSDSDSTHFLLSPREVEPDSAMGDFIKKENNRSSSLCLVKCSRGEINLVVDWDFESYQSFLSFLKEFLKTA
uniref:hypothetical protein n=1 Tax=Vaginimicrobium propionicum TaxID=1871034 RepID=UPI0013903A69|nr:hypothetical protein [Vaginimicrobium propionicum]